jgi:hypothetical protein
MRRPVLPLAGVTAVALALAAPTALGAPAAVSPLTLASGPSPYASCTVGLDPGSPPGTNYVNAETEPFVAVNPTNPANVIGVSQQDRWSNGGSRGLSTFVSFNGGGTWAEPPAPKFSKCAGATGTDYDRSSDPWVSFGPDGTAYQISLSVNAAQNVSAILTSTSTDGGLTWSDPVTVQRDTSGFNFNDKESITADPLHAGTAYAVWDRSRFPSDSPNVNAGHSFAFRGDPMFSKTTDGGATWSTPTRITPLNQNMFTIGNQIVVEPDGTLIDVFHFGKGSGRDAPNASFTGVSRSTDGGATWSKRPIVVSNNPVADDVDPDNGTPLRTGADIGGGLPDIAVDAQSGALYVVWEDSRFGVTHNDIVMSKSTNDGRTWSSPRKVNQTPVPVEAFTPMVDALPGGAVAVTYYDIRNNTPVPGLDTDAFVAVSRDGGTSWEESRITPTSFDDENAPIARGYFLGDYQGLSNDGTTFKSFFVQTNDHDTANRTDVFSTTITP